MRGKTPLQLFIERELGDTDFPLEADIPGDVDYSHPDVGKVARVSSYANEVMHNLRGSKATIKGVITQDGQIAGYEATIKGETYYAPKKDFLVDRAYVEDVFLNSALAIDTRQGLKHWGGQRDYFGPSWAGIEAVCHKLAALTKLAAVEVAGWYRYASSRRPDMDGKDWRYVISDPDGGHVVINCHSLLHDNVWTLATTVFSTSEIDETKLTYIGSRDHYQRAFLWTLATARALQTSGYDYTKAIREITKRMSATTRLKRRASALLPGVLDAVRSVTGERADLPPYSLGVSPIGLPGRSIGGHDPATEEAPYSLLTIHPRAVGDSDYLSIVIQHELIHYALQWNSSHMKEPHGTVFNRIAARLGIPTKYRD